MSKKFTDLPSLATPDATDVLAVVDVSASTSKKTTVAGIHAATPADSLNGSHINWASTGADGGIWWEELGRTTLGSAGDTITVSSLPSRKYLTVIVSLIATGGTVDSTFRLNGDSGSNYSYTLLYNNAATPAISETLTASSVELEVGNVVSGSVVSATLEIVNIAAEVKTVSISSVSIQSAEAVGTRPQWTKGGAKWVNTSNAISSITFTNGGTGDFAIGSEVVVLGHN